MYYCFSKYKSVVKYLILFQLILNSAFAIVPLPDHIVILVLENHSYSQIVGSPDAPYINGLINDNKAAFFSESYGLSHPSQPNYLQIFSGSNQGVTSNNLPLSFPFITPNLGAELIAATKTFIGYSESLPSVGYNGEFSGAYARKHNPWVNWQGISANGIPAASNQPFTSFPSNYNDLPTVSFVVPNEDNDMHNGSDPTTITIGDSWTQANLDGYIQWAKLNNSLCIITFDEDDYFSNQHIYTLFIGQMVQPGSYSNHIDHYNILRLIEDIYNLPHAGAAATALPIDFCWNYCVQPAIITASGPLTFCDGDSVTLTASNGVSYLWSNASTEQSILVTSGNNYSVAITDGVGCTSTSAPVNVSVNNFLSEGIVFNETMGSVSSTTTIATHEINNGFYNDNLTMSGTGDVRNTTTSSGYTLASSAGNIFLTNTIGRNFIISNINTNNLSNLQLSFGINKNSTTSTGADLIVQVSIDGSTYTTLTFPALPTGTGTSIWYYVSTSGFIPATSNLRIRFMQNGTATQYRIDDVSLKYSITSPTITANGPTTFCQGSVVLNSTVANSYIWSNAATSQNITAISSGSYYVIETSTNGCTKESNTIIVTVTVPIISGFNPSAGAPVGASVIINGSNFTGITFVKFNGISAASFTVNSSSQITAVVPPGATSGVVEITNNCGTGNSVSSFSIIPGNPVLDVVLFIEGYYLGGGQMKSVLSPGTCDTVILELHNNISPFNIIHTVKNVISTSGIGMFNLPGFLFNNNYYVVVYNRHSLSAWSSAPVLIGMNNSYDFSTTDLNTYGRNIKNLSDGNFALFSGDINRDGQINLLDFNEIKNASQLFLSGYLIHDLTGDNLIESSDFSLIENNKIPVLTIHP